MQASDVQIDRSKNKGFLIYFGVLGLAGAVILVFTILRGWGFWGWFGAIFLLFASIASVASMAKTGGAGLAPCPRCGHPNPVLHVTIDRYLCCDTCKTWLSGSTSMSVVPDDHVASYPAFDLELPGPFAWLEGCPVCAGPVTRSVKLEGTDTLGDVFSLVAPVSIQQVSKLEAPCCDEHDNGVGLRREGDKVIISFRSLAYWRKFMDANGLKPR